jgi:hypothetical protein
MKGNNMRKLLLFVVAFLIPIAVGPTSASGQSVPELSFFAALGSENVAVRPSAPEQQIRPEADASNTTSQASVAAPQNTTDNGVVIPRGTRVLMALTSPLHSTSGTAGSGVYLEVIAPVVQQDRVVIPAHTYVQGSVEGNRRPGHFNRSSEFRFRFSTMIFPNNSVAAIDGTLQSIPGAKTVRVRGDEGTLRTVDQPEKVLLPAAAGAVGGAIIGSVTRFGIGRFAGAGLGAGIGIGDVLLQRGDDIDLRTGARVEMVLHSDIMLSPAQAKFNATYSTPATELVPLPPASSLPAQDRRRRRNHGSSLLWPLLGAMVR